VATVSAPTVSLLFDGESDGKPDQDGQSQQKSLSQKFMKDEFAQKGDHLARLVLVEVLFLSIRVGYHRRTWLNSFARHDLTQPANCANAPA